MSKITIVAQRVMCDGVMNDGSLFEFVVDCKMKYAKKALPAT